MSHELEILGKAVDKTDAPDHSRRKFMMGAAGALGGMGLIGALPSAASAASTGGPANPNNTTQTILNVAATAEVLATIVNTLGYRRPIVHDKTTRRNIGAAAQEELAHYNVLVGGLGAKPLTTSIWVPNAVFASEKNLLNTLVVGDQIFVNAYLIGVGAFAKVDPKLAAVPAEFMGAEAVHRALALQSLGKLGNDRIFMKVEFTDILDAVKALQAAGFGFGAKGSAPGQFYDFDKISKRTPTFDEVNTPDITPIDA